MINSTSIIRRVDDLGRIVLPKVFRKKHRITEGTPLEICEHENNILLRKFSDLRPFDDSAEKILDSFTNVTKLPVILCDVYSVIASRPNNDLRDKELSDELFSYIQNRNERFSAMQIMRADDRMGVVCEVIFSQAGKSVGALLIPECYREITQSQKDCLRVCAKAIGRMIE